MASIIRRGEKWRVVIRKRGHKTITKTFIRRALADKWAREQEVEIEQRKLDGQHHDLGKLTMKYVEEIGAIKHWERTHESNMRRFAREVAGVTLADLSPDWFVQYARRRKVSPATISQEMYYVSSVLTTAEALWKVPVDWPMLKDARRELKKLKLMGKAKERDRRPQGDELARIKAKLNTSLPVAVLMDFAAATGMRVSEITRLRWADVDAKSKCVLVRDRKHPSEKQGNDQWVPLLYGSWAILKAQPEDGLYVFPYNSRSVTAAYQRARRRAGVKDLRFHDLRHEGISAMFEDGYGIPEVAMVSGHKDWKSLRRYANLKPADLHDGPAAKRNPAGAG